jgi:hypothetical protein
MRQRPSDELRWTPKTLVFSSVVSICGLLVALWLKKLGVWPNWDYAEFVFGALCGATAVHRLHRQRPVIVLLVFVPVMTALLLAGTLLVDLYVFGGTIEL